MEVVPAAEAAAVVVVVVVVAAAAVARTVVVAGAAVVVAVTAVDKLVVTKTVTVNPGIAPVIAARGIRVVAATIVVLVWIRTAKEIGSWFVSRTFPGTEIATGTEIEIATGIVTAIVIVVETVTVIVIVIAIEIGIASTKALAFTIPRIMAGIGTAPTLTSRATETACTQAPAMAAEGKITTRSALTSTEAAHPVDSSRCSPTDLTSRPIAMALCAAIKRAFRTGSGTLAATAFTLSQKS